MTLPSIAPALRAAPLWWACLTAGADTTLHGRVDLNLTRAPGGPVQLAQASTSYLGLKLVQPAGAWRAVAELQAGFDADSGQTERRFFGRESWLGLEGRTGHTGWRVRLGRSRSPLQRVVSRHDPHGTDGVGSAGTGALLLGHSLSRVDNSVFIDVEPAAQWLLSASVAAREGAAQPGWQAWRLRWTPPAHEWNLGGARRGPGNDATVLAWRHTRGPVQATVLGVWGQRQAVHQRVVLVGATVHAAGLQWRLASSRRQAGADPARTLHSLGLDRRLSPRSEVYATWAQAQTRAAGSGAALELGLRHRF